VLAPETRYARLGDVYLAYQVCGEGDRDIVLLSQARIPVDLMWEEPLLAGGLRRLSSVGRLVAMDLRGWGASSQVDPNSLPAMQAWTDDVGCVMDAVGTSAAVIFGTAETCLPSMLFAATHPERADALVLHAPFARYVRAPYYPAGIPEVVAAKYVELYRDMTGTAQLLDIMAPSRSEDSSFRRWWAQAERLGGPPSTVARIYEMFMRTDLTQILDTIQCPTLIVRRAEDRHVRHGHAEYIADRVPNVTLVELPGNDHAWYSGNVDEFLDRVERFLTGARASSPTNRFLATVLFTDIVDSTKRAATLADSEWTALLARHDDLATRHIDAFGGRLVKTTGDGVLATFDGPARAVHCAVALRDVLSDINLTVRTGVHTGEVEQRGDDIAGLGVHIASRIESLAQPGEVLVSRTVTDLVAGSGLEFADRGDHELKGVPGSWRVFSVTG
jgi:class 3 adenylate cyclase